MCFFWQQQMATTTEGTSDSSKQVMSAPLLEHSITELVSTARHAASFQQMLTHLWQKPTKQQNAASRNTALLVSMHSHQRPLTTFTQSASWLKQLHSQPLPLHRWSQRWHVERKFQEKHRCCEKRLTTALHHVCLVICTTFHLLWFCRQYCLKMRVKLMEEWAKISCQLLLASQEQQLFMKTALMWIVLPLRQGLTY